MFLESIKVSEKIREAREASYDHAWPLGVNRGQPG